MYIYKITNLLNNQFYIGQSLDYRTRWAAHIRSSYSSVGKAIHDYGVNNFKFEVLFECNQRDANLLESYLIFITRAIELGYNKVYSKVLTDGDKIKAEIILNKIYSGNYTLTGEVMHRGAADTRKVYCIDEDIIFGNAYECSIFYNIVSATRVREVCDGKRATANNLHFRYLDEDENIIEPEKPAKQKNKAVYVVETGLVYESVSMACKELGLDYNACKGAIGKCLKGQRVTAKGYHWRYFENDTIVETDRTNQHEYPVIVDKNPDLVFDSISDALDYLGLSLINRGSIYQCINGRSATAFGHTWNKIDSSGYIIETGFEYSDIDRSKVKKI